jgi:putative lipoic acid-binding regulatory protein
MAESLIEFPSDFPIKIMGKQQPDFAQLMLQIVLRHAPDYDAATIEMRPSRTGAYISLTCTIRATSQEQLDALYRELSAHPLVQVVL